MNEAKPTDFAYINVSARLNISEQSKNLRHFLDRLLVLTPQVYDSCSITSLSADLVSVNIGDARMLVRMGIEDITIYHSIETTDVTLWNEHVKHYFKNVVEAIADTTPSIIARIDGLPDIEERYLRMLLCAGNQTITSGLAALLRRMGVRSEILEQMPSAESIIAGKFDFVLFDTSIGCDDLIRVSTDVVIDSPNTKTVVFADSYSATRFFYRFRRAGVKLVFLKTTPWNYWWYAIHNVFCGTQWTDPHLNKWLSPAVSGMPSVLSDIELRIWQRLRMSTEELAQELSISVDDTKHVVESLLSKLGVHTVDAAMDAAGRAGLTVLPSAELSELLCRKEELTAESYCDDLDQWFWRKN